MRPHLIFVRAGTLDDPEIAKPARNHLDVIGAQVGLHERKPAENRAAAAAGGDKPSQSDQKWFSRIRCTAG